VSVSTLLDQVKQVAIAKKQGLSKNEVISIARQLFRIDNQIKAL